MDKESEKTYDQPHVICSNNIISIEIEFLTSESSKKNESNSMNNRECLANILETSYQLTTIATSQSMG